MPPLKAGKLPIVLPFQVSKLFRVAVLQASGLLKCCRIQSLVELVLKSVSVHRPGQVAESGSLASYAGYVSAHDEFQLHIRAFGNNSGSASPTKAIRSLPNENGVALRAWKRFDGLHTVTGAKK